MKPYSLNLRQKVIETDEAGGISQHQLVKNFRVTVSFVQSLVKQKRELGTIAPKVRTEQTPTKLNAERLNVLRQPVEAQPDATLAEFQERLQQKTGGFIGMATVDRMIRLKLKLTLKKSLYPTKQGTDEVQLARFEYWQLLKGIPPENLVCLDESGINLSFVRRCARSLSGTRAYRKRPSRRGKNVSVSGAISLNGLLVQWSALGALMA